MVRAVMRARGIDASGRPSGAAEAHRMVLGALTSGLAHELNNPLAAVIANLDLATRQVEEQVRAVSSYSWLDDLNAELQDARDASDMLHGIVKRLRPLGPRAPSRDDTDLSSVLEASMALLGRELRRRGRLRHPAPVADKVVVRPSWHLATHAVLGTLSHVLQSLPSGDEDREIAMSIEVRSRHTVQLQIVATPGVEGPPSRAAIAARKMAVSLAQEAGATLVDGPSDAQEWSCVLEVPLRYETTPPIPPPRQQSERVGRVLVIDDEPLIGKLVTRILGAHDVVVVHDGTTGLARARREAWDLVLLDMNLPDLPGEVVATELANLAPETSSAVVRMSGGLMEPRPSGQKVLAKPFDPAALRELLKARLQER